MAIDSNRKQDRDSAITWEEESGLLGFLRTIHAEVKRFDETFDLGVEMLPGQPDSIDGSTEELKYLGFVVLRRNSALIGRDYCLYSVLRGKALHGYIGVYRDGAVTTARELNAITDYRRAQAGLLGWLRGLVKASCEKI
jgi:hypothetical protein